MTTKTLKKRLDKISDDADIDTDEIWIRLEAVLSADELAEIDSEIDAALTEFGSVDRMADAMATKWHPRSLELIDVGIERLKT